MKKIAFLTIIALISLLTVKAQKDVGTVYSEHEAINKTKAMYAAFVKGDKETFINFFTDTITLISNGTSTKMAIKNLGSNIDYWQGFANLSFNDDSPAVPKAIQYKKDGLWVLDWLRGIGIHKATGIRVDLPFTNEYRFNKDGKIDTWIQYADMTILTEIWKSQKTIESGVIYKYHPYINNTRKAVNAWAAKDMETWLSFYTPDAVFGSLSLKNDETIDLKTKKANTQKTFDNYATIVLVQSGEPVCVAYEREYYVVYSWWVLSVTAKDNKKKSNIPVMLTHGFDNNGKIKWESVYMDSKRLE